MTSLGLITLQRRMRELGRIRLGEKGVANNGKTFPKKLSGFRLTSASEQTLIVAASLYGGEVRRWEGAPGEGKQWELYMGDRIDVLLPPGESLSQSFEMWSGGGCVRRCNGMTTEDGEGCLCPVDIEEKMAAAAKGAACKPTTRLGLILPRLPDIGVWRMESHGYNAAVELPGTVEILRALAGAGHMVPAFLRIDQRTSVKDGQTRHFIVPVLELPSVTIAELQSGGGVAALGEGSTPALNPAPPAAPSSPPPAAPPSPPKAAPVPPKAAVRPPLPGEQPADADFRENLSGRLNKIPMADRAKTYRAFTERFGSLDQLSATQAHAAEAFVAGFEHTGDAAPPPPVEGKPRRQLSTAQKLHLHAKECGVSEGDLDALILVETGGRTSSAKELDKDVDGDSIARLRVACDEVRAGRLDMAAIHRAVEALSGPGGQQSLATP